MNNLFIQFALIALLFSGCRREPQDLVITSVNTTTQSGEMEININRSLFSSPHEELNETCEMFNDQIALFIQNLEDSVQSSATQLFNDLKRQNIPLPSWKYSFYVTDSVFMATTEFISLRLTVYTFTGGAHGMTQFYAFNFDIKNQQLISSREILKESNPEEINQLLKNHFKNPEGCFSTDPTAEKASTINLSKDGACFTFAQYKLGPYSCGAAEITIPWPEIR